MPKPTGPSLKIATVLSLTFVNLPVPCSWRTTHPFLIVRCLLALCISILNFVLSNTHSSTILSYSIWNDDKSQLVKETNLLVDGHSPPEKSDGAPGGAPASVTLMNLTDLPSK